jgi:hypothetical protein
LTLDDVEVFRSRFERDKRSYLKIEDHQIGTGAVASWGRRLKAEIEVKYADDGKIIYKGPIVTYFGYLTLFPEHLSDWFMLDYINQAGIQLGLNGMAVSGHRRITISRELVCGINDGGCYLLRPEREFVNEIPVHKKALVVEVTLTESCVPVRFRWRDSGGFLRLVDMSVGCRTKDEPKIGGSDWHIY